LKEASGTQFDPSAVDAFVRLYEADEILALDS
jgi:HD-GYP domain-containing protein (c-di-GMP phosphodiesterase class II)